MSLLNKASLIQIPSGYKDGTLYSAKPTNGDGDFTFSRGSNLAATRVSDGLIEKGRENLLLQSNQFDTTWSLENLSVTSGQSGYDGSSDAWKVTPTIDDTYHRLTNAVSGAANSVVTLSVYAKADGYNFIRVSENGTTGDYATFNLSTGIVENNTSLDAKIESIGSGWYRCSSTIIPAATHRFDIYVMETATVQQPWDGDGVSGILIQSAQLEVGLISTPYIETGASTAQAGILEDMPRLDYSGGATCPSLLLEPQRTNALPHSEWIGGWTAANSATIDGVQSFTLPSSLSRIQAGSIGNPSGDFVFYAVFDSADIGKTIKLAYYDVTAAGWNQGTDITIDSNGRAERTISTGSNIVGNVAFYGKSTSESYTLKYCQFEAGSYATSYIPTYGASVTRGADSCSKTGISSLIGQTEGTMYWEGTFQNSQNPILMQLIPSTGGYTSSLYFEYAGGAIRVRVFDSGTTQATFSVSASLNTNYKIAFAYKENNFAAYVNGTSIGTDTSGTVQSGLSEIYLGLKGNFTEPFTGTKPKKVLVFPTRLSNDELATLTTI